MKTLARSLGGFLYSLLISVAFSYGAVWLLTRCLVYAEGFWMSFLGVCLIIYSISWVAEKGLQFLSLPYNWLWNERFATRLSSCIPTILLGLWTISSPWRISFKFSVGDWSITIIWLCLVAGFYYNLASMPFVNLDIGKIDSRLDAMQ